MKKINYLLVLFLVFTACDNREENYSISLSKDRIIADYAGSTQIIEIQSNDDNWTILASSIPEWCNIKKKKLSTHDVSIVISPNYTAQSREASIVFNSKTSSCSLYILQEGKPKKPDSSLLDWYTFPVNTFSNIEFNPDNDNTGYNCKISAEEIYINQSIKDKIFHGNLIHKKMDSINGMKEYTQYSYNPITISAYVNKHFYSRDSIYPSFHNTESLYSEIKSNSLEQNITFSYQTSPIQYKSYKHLNFLGVGNLGLKLDEIIIGKSYLEKEFKKQTGLIYSYCNVLFNITMDLPYNLIKETILEGDEKELCYINNMKYGKMAFLILETDYDYKASVLVVEKIMKGIQLDDYEMKVKNSINASYLFFNEKGNINIIKGTDVIRMFVLDINNQPIIPLSFSVNDYDRNAVGNLELTIKVP